MNADLGNRKATDEPGLFRAAVLLFALLFGLLLLAFGADQLLRTDNFPVRHVRFEGEFKHVTQQELQAAVMNVVHGNAFLINLDAVKERVESLPWVYQASVRRQWPQDLSVQFTEQKLVAYWGENSFLNQVGDVVRVKVSDLPPEFLRLDGPEGTGPLVLEHASKLGGILSAAGLKLERATLTPRRTWRLVVSNSRAQEGASSETGTPTATMTIVLDREQPERKLERFARAYMQSLATLMPDIKQVDLRYANGFAVEQDDARADGFHGASNRVGAGHAAVANRG
jgi:cell division protein FtsQ